MKNLIAKKLGLLCCLIVAPAVLIAAPNLIHFQGRLTDNQGSPIVGPDVSVKFSLYSLASGGNLLWDAGAEQLVATNSAGLFSTDIGPVPINVFSDNNDLYLQVQVRGTTGLKVLSPRQKLASVPYAFQANFTTYAVNSATAAFAQTVADDSITSSKIQNGSITTEKIGDLQVTDAKIISMSAPKISSAIVQSQISTGAVGNAQLADLSVTDAKIIDVSAGKITGTIGTDQIANVSITNAKVNDVAIGKISGVLPKFFVTGEPSDYFHCTGNATEYFPKLPTVLVDTDNAYNVNTGVYTIPSTGVWEIGWHVYMAINDPSATAWWIAIYKNGVELLMSGIDRLPLTNLRSDVEISIPYYMDHFSQGDKLSVMVVVLGQSGNYASFAGGYFTGKKLL